MPTPQGTTTGLNQMEETMQKRSRKLTGFIIVAATAMMMLTGCSKGNLGTIEIYIDKDGQIAFPEEIQIDDDGIPSIKYTDFETLRERLKTLHKESMEKSECHAIVVHLSPVIEDSDYSADDSLEESEGNAVAVSDSIADPLVLPDVFINAAPDARHSAVARVLNCAAQCGYWQFTFGSIEYKGKVLPIGVCRPEPASGFDPMRYIRGGDYDDEGNEIQGAELKRIWHTRGAGEHIRKTIAIGINKGWQGDQFIIAGEKINLAAIDNLLGAAGISSSKIDVCICCSGESSHKTLVALLSVCTKHEIPPANISLFTI